MVLLLLMLLLVLLLLLMMLLHHRRFDGFIGEPAILVHTLGFDYFIENTRTLRDTSHNEPDTRC